jgi:hypothetical protein
MNNGGNRRPDGDINREPPGRLARLAMMKAPFAIGGSAGSRAATRATTDRLPGQVTDAN